MATATGVVVVGVELIVVLVVVTVTSNPVPAALGVMVMVTEFATGPLVVTVIFTGIETDNVALPRLITPSRLAVGTLERVLAPKRMVTLPVVLSVV